MWFDLDNDLHVTITKQIATWANELSRIQSNQIGSIYMRWTDAELQFFIGPPVLPDLFRRRRLLYRVKQGPFEYLEEYCNTLLELQLLELQDEKTISLSGMITRRRSYVTCIKTPVTEKS